MPPDVWLLARRSASDPTEIAYDLAWAPPDATLRELAQMAATRYIVEQCREEAKGEPGFDEYEVRLWPSWHRHLTLSMLAPTWLAPLPAAEAEKGGESDPALATLTGPEVRRLLEVALPRPARSVELCLAWSHAIQLR